MTSHYQPLGDYTHSAMESSKAIWYVQQSTSTLILRNKSYSLPKANATSLPLPRVVHVLTEFATVTTTTTAMQVYGTDAPTPSHYTWTPSPTAQLSSTPSSDPSRLSPNAAIGIGFAAGVIGIIILLAAALFLYRCWRIRRSSAVHKYEQARLWKGFTPATPSTARTTLHESKMANIYLAEIQSPSTPAFMWSPPPNRPGQRWSATTWTPGLPPAELSV
jgi:hypothetical protein